MKKLETKVKKITGSYNPSLELALENDAALAAAYIDFTDRETGRFPESQKGLELLETAEVLFWL